MSLSKHLAGVHGVTKSQTWVSDWTKTVLFKSSCSVLFKSCMIHHIRDGVERGAGGTKCWIPFSQFKFLLNFKISQVLHNLIELLTIFGFVRKCSTLCFLTRWQGPIKLMRLTKVFRHLKKLQLSSYLGWLKEKWKQIGMSNWVAPYNWCKGFRESHYLSCRRFSCSIS